MCILVFPNLYIQQNSGFPNTREDYRTLNKGFPNIYV
jgi:hypothetical protein